MPTISYFRGIRVFICWNEHNPPHFHAEYGDDEVSVLISELEGLSGGLPGKQLKMLLGWAALHQEELMENWLLAAAGKSVFSIDPLH